MKPWLPSQESTHSRRAEVTRTPAPSSPVFVIALASSSSGKQSLPFYRGGERSPETQPSWDRSPSLRDLSHQRLGMLLKCLQLPPSLTVNDLPVSLSKINKHVLKFNYKSLAFIIYIECFSSSKRPVWDFSPP